MASGDATERKKYTFHPIPNRQFGVLSRKEIEECLLRWSLKGRILLQAFAFDQIFKSYAKDEFFLDFLTNGNVKAYLQLPSDKPCSFSKLFDDVTRVEVEDIDCSVFSLAFFDKIYNNELVRQNSNVICQCMDEWVDDMQLCDNLKQSLVLEASDYYSFWDENDRRQFIFRIFQFLVLGGRLSQFEQTVDNYLEVTKHLYKELVSVQRDPNTQNIRAACHVYKVTGFDKDGRLVFPSNEEHPQNFCYAIVEPQKKNIVLFSHMFGVGALPTNGV